MTEQQQNRWIERLADPKFTYEQVLLRYELSDLLGRDAWSDSDVDDIYHDICNRACALRRERENQRSL